MSCFVGHPVCLWLPYIHWQTANVVLINGLKTCCVCLALQLHSSVFNLSNSVHCNIGGVHSDHSIPLKSEYSIQNTGYTIQQNTEFNIIQDIRYYRIQNSTEYNRIQNTEFHIQNTEYRTQNIEHRIQNTK